MRRTLLVIVVLAGVLVGLQGCTGQATESTAERAASLAADVAAAADVPASDEPRFRYVVVIADPHIEEADGPHAENARLIGEEIAGMPWPIEAVFVLGDVVFQIPYTTLQEFIDDPADKFDTAQAIFDDYPVPVYPLIGNHDMDNGPDPWNELCEQLFARHFGVDPYYAVDIGDFRFLALSNFKGPTHDIGGPGYDYNSGSFGETQLAWMQEQVDEGRPSILMTHFPPFVIQDVDDFLRDNSDTVRLFLAGHSHGWLSLSDHYGVPAMVVGTCMYDADSLMILELDNLLHTWRMLNWDKVHWGTGYALPWDDDED